MNLDSEYSCLILRLILILYISHLFTSLPSYCEVKLILIIKELKIANAGRHWTRCHGLWDLSLKYVGLLQ